jgi:hypothetical protein
MDSLTPILEKQRFVRKTREKMEQEEEEEEIQIFECSVQSM